jgi:hypothetical protein
MIKRISWLKRPAALSAVEFQARWLRTYTSAVRSCKPLRAVACVVLHDAPGCDVPHDAISMEWFSGPGSVAQPMAAEATLLASEHVLRGADWLEQRWSQPLPKYKHMALAQRARGLTATQFSERWRNRPGRVGAVEIPAAARGHAYVQNHPLGEDPPYDAVNEVYFDDLASMHSRIELFAKLDVLQADADLVSATRFAIVVEHVIA